MGKHQSYRIVAGDGPPCPRCNRSMQIREHRNITAKVLRQPYYYRRWYYCLDGNCKVTLHMDEQFKVLSPVVWGDSWDEVDKQKELAFDSLADDLIGDDMSKPPWEE